jgi:hypothetical protein
VAIGGDDGAACERTHAKIPICDYCGDPLPPPSPKFHGKVRRFCSPKHRAAWRRRELERKVTAVLDAAGALQRFLAGDDR